MVNWEPTLWLVLVVVSFIIAYLMEEQRARKVARNVEKRCTERMQNYVCMDCGKSIEYEYVVSARDKAKKDHQEDNQRFRHSRPFRCWTFHCPHCQRLRTFIENPRPAKRKRGFKLFGWY